MYKDRRQAGRRLGEMLKDYRGSDAVVLSLPRGGVEVGFEVAEALDAELDVLIVRKLGAPQNPELGFGAIASHGGRYIDRRSVDMLRLDEDTIDEIERRERKELQRRESLYRGGRGDVKIEGRTTILVDDGVATGGTTRAALRAVKPLNPARLILAVPVGPPDTIDALSREVDEVVCPMTPPSFQAIGQWYQRFDQTPDEVVVELLQNRDSSRGPAPDAPGEE